MVWKFLKRLMTEFLYDQAILHLTCPHKSVMRILLAALFIIESGNNPNVHYLVNESTKCSLPIKWDII